VDRERQAHFGEFIRHPERAAGESLDAVQTAPDSVRVNVQLGGGIGEVDLTRRALRPNRDGVPAF
jgi:hypothetical protein